MNKSVVTSLIREAMAAPWKLENEIKRWLIYPLVRIQFWLVGISWKKGWKIYGMPILQIYRGSNEKIGDNLELRSTLKSNPLAPHHPVVISTRNAQSILSIGDHFSMTGGSLVVTKQVEIGDHVMIGANSLVMDTDFHPLDPQIRRSQPLAGKSKPVVIGNDVFVGTQAIILKGAQIQSGSVVGAGVVVRK